jgi:hypothetical protein
MVELFASPVGWLSWRISSPHPREPLQKGLTKGGIAGFYIIMPPAEKKLIRKLNNFFLVSYKLSTTNAPEAMESTPLHASPGCTTTSITSPSLLFLVGCCVLVCQWRPIKATMYFIFYFCANPCDAPNNGTLSSHTLFPDCASSYSSHLPQLPTFGWLFHVAA